MSGSTRSYEMARRMVLRGHEVHLITSDRRANPCYRGWRQEDIDGIQVHWFPVPYRNADGHKQRVKSFLRFAFHATTRAFKLAPDLIFASSTPLTVSLPALLVAWARKRPFVFEARDLWPELPIAVGALKNPIARWLAHVLERETYRRACAIVALSPGIAKGIQKQLQQPTPLHVIPNACDGDLFGSSHNECQGFRDQHPELGEAPFVLYAGTLGRINNVAYLAHVAKHCLDRCGADSPKFVVIGHGAEDEDIRAAAENLGVLGRNFFMYRPVSKREVVQAYQAASLGSSIFADVPEMENNSANKFFDTLASGTAVAINYGGWQAALVQEHDLGLVLDRDPAKAADAIVGLLGAPERLQVCADNAHRLAGSQFDREDLAEQLVKVLETAVHDFRATNSSPSRTCENESGPTSRSLFQSQ